MNFHPDFDLYLDDTIHSIEPLVPDKVLNESEVLARSVLLASRHPIRFDQMVEAFERAGLAKVTAALTLAASPIVRKLSRDRYVLLGPDAVGASFSDHQNSEDDAKLEAALAEEVDITPLSPLLIERIAKSEGNTQPMGTLETAMTPVEQLVTMVKSGTLQLPEIQRAYVWTRPQVRDLVDSLYRGYPVGTMLVWYTEEQPIASPINNADEATLPQPVQFLLDGQQRLTSLSKIMLDGDPDLRFNVETEEFQVANAAIRRDPKWISVYEIFAKGPLAVLKSAGLMEHPDWDRISSRLSRLENIKRHTVPVNKLSGFSYDEVTEIFVRVNSKGTRLRVAELAIARLAFRLPGMVSNELKAFEEELDENGWDIDLRFLLRCLTAVATGQSRFDHLGTVGEDDLRRYWKSTRESFQTFLNLLDKNLGIESVDWLPSTTALVVPIAYLARTPAKEVNVNSILRWFLLASTWGRYTSASETALDQDLRILTAHSENPTSSLIERLRQGTGRLEVMPDDLDDASIAGPFLLMAYLACRHQGAIDWWTGVKLSSTNLGASHLIELHHIFPKALISENNSRRDVNEIANLAFLSQQANRQIGKREPSVYLQTIDPERLQRQMIPMDETLWSIDRFQAFLATRRELLAEGINAVFESLTG